MPLPRFILLLTVVIALAGATVLLFAQVPGALGLSGLAVVIALLMGLRLVLGRGR
ncbi:hypothetical protein [Actibacterium ureilyticum]|uniref:hypothetical protein n=1 Tax=Actibacterium ureilyticum TaxID=1590614 RepID=UPI00159585FD|nr:hypothetical protein [Actibacterium ureilyticum]